MLATAQMLNLAVRFAVEIALLTAVAAAAWQGSSASALRWVAAVGAVLAVSALWVLIVHNDDLPAPVRLLAQAAALTLGISCLLWLNETGAAAALTVIALLNAALLAAWNQ